LESQPTDKPAGSFTLEAGKDASPAVRLSASADGGLVGIRLIMDNTLVICRNENGTLVEMKRFEVPKYSTFSEMSPSGRSVWSHSGSIETASGTRLQKLNRANTNSPPEDIGAVWLGESRVAEVVLLQSNDAKKRGDAERSLVLWNTVTGDRDCVAFAPEANALAAAPDGGQLAEGGKDMRVRIRNGSTLAVERTLRVHDGPVINVAWHPTLPLLATASEDYSVRIWDLRTDTLVEEFRTTRNAPSVGLKWSPDGRFLGVSYLAPSDNLKVYEPKACRGDLK
jgi:WD40 repeat protein